MNTFWKRIQEEPAVIFSVVNAVLALVVLFGVPLTEQQAGGIIVLVNVIVGFLTRQQVTPTIKVDAKVDAAVEDALTAEAEPLTPEERATLDALRAERDSLRRDARGRTP